jgi:hypothetical protein
MVHQLVVLDRVPLGLHQRQHCSLECLVQPAVRHVQHTRNSHNATIHSSMVALETLRVETVLYVHSFRHAECKRT